MNIEKPIITGLGEVLWDVYPDKKYLGGAPANAAIHASQLGAQGKIVSSVGKDPQGTALIKQLQFRGIDTSLIQVSKEHPTGSVQVNLDEKGVPRFVCSENTAFDFLQWDSNMENCAKESHAVITGTLPQRNPVSRKTIQEFLDSAEKSLIVYDVNFREWNKSVHSIVMETAQKSDILKLNESECKNLKEILNRQNLNNTEFIEFLTDYFNLKMCALTLGHKGAVLFYKHTISKPALKINVKDTTGCGDAFTAAITLSFLKNETPEQILDFSILVSSYTATKISAVPVYNQEDIDKFRKKIKNI